MRVEKLDALTSTIMSGYSALSVLGHAAIMDGKLEVEHQTWVLAASPQQLNGCHQPSKFLIWTSRWLLVQSDSTACHLRNQSASAKLRTMLLMVRYLVKAMPPVIRSPKAHILGRCAEAPPELILHYAEVRSFAT